MVQPLKTDVAVIGAGIIGLTTALRLAAAGREVVVIDPNRPGCGASHGNAGTLAPYACAPVGNPDVLRNLPRLLFSPESPLSIRPTALPALLPWLARFARESLPNKARRNGYALAALLKEALPAWRDLGADAELSDLFRQEGCLYVYRKGLPASHRDWSMCLREELGVRQEWLTSTEIAKLEPKLPPASCGLFFPDAVHIVDPGVLSERLAIKVKSYGASFRCAYVERLEPHRSGHIRLKCGDRNVDAHSVVVAAGAWSRSLARQAGEHIPLDTERGYHIEFAMEVAPLGRPVCPVELGFYMTPMQGRLRVAGMVELGGLAAPSNPKLIALLERGVRKLLPDIGPAQPPWLGLRPSLPDSKPVIGRSRRHPNVILAFGHGHLGMTLAGITSRAVAGLIEQRDDLVDLSAFRPDRFG
ncbi:MAG: NAD(P)/FAD-dependent oxidoreductase [Hyphomicrobiales bacterium]